jgi:hypothetical protein
MQAEGRILTIDVLYKHIHIGIVSLLSEFNNLFKITMAGEQISQAN